MVEPDSEKKNNYIPSDELSPKIAMFFPKQPKKQKTNHKTKPPIVIDIPKWRKRCNGIIPMKELLDLNSERNA